jgi:hypothetical protein
MQHPARSSLAHSVQLPRSNCHRTPTIRRQIFSLECILKDLLVQAQVRHQRLELAILFFKLLEPTKLRHPMTANCFFHPKNACSLTPIFRHTSTIGVPAFACLSANATSSSVNLLFFVDQPPEQRPS